MNPHSFSFPDLPPDAPTFLEDTGHEVRLHLLRHYADVIRLLADELLSKPVVQPAARESIAPAPPVEAVAEPTAVPEDADRLNAALTLLQTRSLAEDPVVALWLGGVQLRGVHIVLCTGVTLLGYRRMLDFVACAPEDVPCLTKFLQRLVARGLSADEGLLCILPSGTGLQIAVRSVFGPRIAIQRCLNAKLAHVTGGLSDQVHGDYRSRLRQAWQLADVNKAEAALMDIHADLKRINRSAGHALLEGLQETLTIQRTGQLLKTDKGLRVMHSLDSVGRTLVVPASAVFQRMERMALTLLEQEAGMRRVAHAAYLSVLRTALLTLNKR